MERSVKTSTSTNTITAKGSKNTKRKSIDESWKFSGKPEREIEKNCFHKKKGNVNAEMKKVEEGEEDRTGNRDKRKFWVWEINDGA